MVKLYVFLFLVFNIVLNLGVKAAPCEKEIKSVSVITAHFDRILFEMDSLDRAIDTSRGIDKEKVYKASQELSKALKFKQVILVKKEQEAIKDLFSANQSLKMCKTHFIKYPISLKVLEKISRNGCHKFEMKNYSDAFAMDAQMETFEVMCSQKNKLVSL